MKKKYIIVILFLLSIFFIAELFLAVSSRNEKNVIINNPNQWALHNSGQKVEGQNGINGYDLNALESWEVTKGDKEILVGIVDTGIDISNVFIKDSIYINKGEIINGTDDDGNGFIDDVNGWNFYDDNNEIYSGITSDYHGTFITSLISGEHSEENSVWGISPNVTILPLKFMNGSSGSIEDAIDAIKYGYNQGAKIFNLSWDSSVYDENLYELIKKYEDAIFITSAGKGTINTDESPLYPCNFDLNNLICVSAVDNSGNLEKFSGYGEDLVNAPGVDIYGLLPQNNHTFSDGTSYATAYVTGIAALAKSINSEIPGDLLAQLIKESEREFDNNTKIIDSKKLLEKIQSNY